MALLPQNQRDQIMLVVCIALLGLGYVYYEYVWKKKNDEIVILAAHVDTLKTENEKTRRDIARGTTVKIKQEAEQYGRLLLVMRQLVPVANEVPTLLDQISTAARQAGLELGEVTPLGTITGDVFDTYRYKMGVTGPYHRVARFLNNVGQLTRIVAPMNVSLSPSSKQSPKPRPGETLLDVNFEIQTYVAKTAMPAVVPAAGGPGQ
jgi:type IV pilus assembly protein PilO